MIMRIDAHHHFWNYNATEFGWLDGAMASLKRNFGPADLLQAIDPTPITHVISVEARESETETQFLLDQAEQHDWIAAVVGYVPLESPDVAASLERFAVNPKFKGVRKVMQGLPAGALLAEDFNRGIAQLKKFDLTYDILIYAEQLPEAVAFVDRHPEQVFVLDHLGKPDIARDNFSDWSREIYRLAERDNVFCKISGLVTEANWHTWRPDQLQPYFDYALIAFGPERCMFGSDWPVCLVAADYGRWAEVVQEWTDELQLIDELSAAESEQLWAGSAIQAYGLTEFKL